MLSPQPWSKIAAFLAVVVAVAAFDASGCLVGSGRAALPQARSFPGGRLDAYPECTRYASSRSPTARETVLWSSTRVTKGPADLCFGRCSAGSAGSLSLCGGWGFHPKSQLIMEWSETRSASEQPMGLARLDDHIRRPLPYSGPLRVTNPDGETAELAHVSF